MPGMIEWSRVQEAILSPDQKHLAVNVLTKVNRFGNSELHQSVHVFTLANSVTAEHFSLTLKGSICHKYQPLDQVNEEGKLAKIS